MERVLRDELFRRGFSLLMTGHYFEAHEVWEDLWRGMDRDDELRDFVRGMIMLAAAYHKLLFQGNVKGALGLFGKAFDRLDRYSIPDERLKSVVEFSRGFRESLKRVNRQ